MDALRFCVKLCGPYIEVELLHNVHPAAIWAPARKGCGKVAKVMLCDAGGLCVRWQRRPDSLCTFSSECWQPFRYCVPLPHKNVRSFCLDTPRAIREREREREQAIFEYSNCRPCSSIRCHSEQAEKMRMDRCTFGRTACLQDKTTGKRQR